MKFIPHVIDGQECESASGARFATGDALPIDSGQYSTEPTRCPV
jgi:hypothetical protein